MTAYDEVVQRKRQDAFTLFVTEFQDDLQVSTAQKIADNLDVSFFVEEIV